MAAGRTNVSGGALKINPKPVLVGNYLTVNTEPIKKGALVGFNHTGKIENARRSQVILKNGTNTTNSNNSADVGIAKLDEVPKVVSIFRRSSPQNPVVYCEEINLETLTLVKGTEVVVESITSEAQSIVALTNRLSFAVYAYSGIIKGVVIDNTGGTTLSVKTPANIISSGYAMHLKILKLSETQVAIFWRGTDTQLKGIIATINLDNFTFTLGIVLLIDGAGSAQPRPIFLESGILGLGYYTADGVPNYNYKFRLLSFNGDVLATVGSVVSVNTMTAYSLHAVTAFNKEKIAFSLVVTSQTSTYLITRDAITNALSIGPRYNFGNSSGPEYSTRVNDSQILEALTNNSPRIITHLPNGTIFVSPSLTTTFYNNVFALIDVNTFILRDCQINAVISSRLVGMVYNSFGVSDSDASPNALIKINSF
jgi:hypothetical protein